MAILAGLYTNKLISIRSEKERLESKIKEIKIKVKSKVERITVLQNQIEEVDKKNIGEKIDTFIQDVITDVEENHLEIKTRKK